MIALATLISVVVTYTIINLVAGKYDKKVVASSDDAIFINTANHA